MTNYLLLALKGCAMGMADVIPGVSGGTIAFISGIYTELIESIKKLGGPSLRLLAALRLREFWREINGNFLGGGFRRTSCRGLFAGAGDDLPVGAPPH